MIAIAFEPKYEDRVSLFFKHIDLKGKGIEFDFMESPDNLDYSLAYWLIKPMHNKHINYVLSSLREMKSIMGIEDLTFSYCSSVKEFYTQYNIGYGLTPWFKV